MLTLERGDVWFTSFHHKRKEVEKAVLGWFPDRPFVVVPAVGRWCIILLGKQSEATRTATGASPAIGGRNEAAQSPGEDVEPQ